MHHELIDTIKGKGGFTVTLSGHTVKDGFAVSLPIFRRAISLDTTDETAIEAVYEQCRIAGALIDCAYQRFHGRSAFAAVGGWFDSDADVYELAVSLVFYKRGDAEWSARQFGERFYADLAAFARGEDGARPLTVN